jgi:hypothetical protein
MWLTGGFFSGNLRVRFSLRRYTKLKALKKRKLKRKESLWDISPKKSKKSKAKYYFDW